jgi:hypothetical protein
MVVSGYTPMIKAEAKAIHALNPGYPLADCVAIAVDVISDAIAAEEQREREWARYEREAEDTYH